MTIKNLKKELETRINLPIVATHKHITNSDVICYVEGKDDEYFYIERIKHCENTGDKTIHFENLNGKDRVLNELKKCTVDKNRMKLGQIGLFFIDKDLYDFLEMPQPYNDNLFITEGYSFENYLVQKDILAKLLISSPKRKEILNAFEMAYKLFVEFLHPIFEILVTTQKHHGIRNVKFYSVDELSDFYNFTNKLEFQTSDHVDNFINILESKQEDIQLVKNHFVKLPLEKSEQWIRGRDAMRFFQRFCSEIKREFNSFEQRDIDELKRFIKMLSKEADTSLKLSKFLNYNFQKL